MPAAATVARNGDTARDQQGTPSNGDAPRPMTPFVRASRQAITPFHDESNTLAATARQVGPEDVLARGFLRNIVLEVTLTGGEDGTTPAVVGDDGIFGVLDQVRLTDTAGGQLVQLSGYSLYLANKYLAIGSLASIADPKLSPAYSAIDTDGNGTFRLRVPVEISERDALGALANQNSSSTYKLEYTIAAASTLFTDEPDTLPTVRVRAYLEYWTQPQAQTFDGRPNATMPPAHGTTRFLSQTTYNLSSGESKVRLQRVGNFLQALLAVYRVSNARSDANLPDTPTLTYDAQDVSRQSLAMHRADTAERLGLTAANDAAGGLDNGVFGWDWDHDLDGRPGNSLRSHLLPTTTATDLRIEGNFGAAGVLTVITADIAPAGPIFAG